MRIRATTAITTLLALGAFAVSAAAADSVSTEIDASFKKGTADNPYVPERDPAFKGTVESKDSDCEAKRKVKIKGVGSDKTDSKGRFKIDAPGVGADTYKVKVAKREVGKTVCEAAKTKVRVKNKDL
jgi:hypothetical protein